jgi:hypothetical protein
MREGGFRNVGGLAQRLTSQIARGQGNGRGTSIVRLRIDWPAIVGPELARTTRPEALTAGRGGKAGARVLRLRVSGAAALEVQHMSGQLIDKVNTFAGYRLVDDIKLIQGAVMAAPAPRPPLPRPPAEVARKVEGQVATVQDSGLRAALARLGARVAVGRRSAIVGVLGSLLLARGARAQADLLAPLPGDHVLGKPDARNVIIDYFSLTCPHCANFNAAVLPRLRREGIDKGHVALVMRHFPSDSVATHAAQVAEGAGPARFFDVVDTLFRSQVDWMTSSAPEAEMVRSLAPLGISAAEAATFMGNDDLLMKVVFDVQTGQALKVRATPTLFINGQFFGSPPGGAEGADTILRQLGL